MDAKYRFEQFVKDAKKRADETVEKAKNGVITVAMWAVDHPEEAMAIGTAVAFGVRQTTKVLGQYKDYRRRNLDIYDPTKGTWWHLRKPLSTEQMLEVERRRATGESYGAILESMNMLKH